MARRGAVGLEGIVGPVFAALEVRFPLVGKVLRNAPLIRPRPSDDAVDDPARADAVFLLLQNIRRGEEGFHSVHVGVDAAVAVQDSEFRVPGVAGHPLFFIPEIPVINVQRFLQEFRSSGAAAEEGGGCGEDHKSVGIALFVGEDASVRPAAGVPAAVFYVAELACQSLKGLVGQFFAARVSQETSETVHMHHPAGDPGLPGAVFPWRSVISQIIGAACRGGKTVAEAEKIPGVPAEEVLVLCCVQLILFQ